MSDEFWLSNPSILFHRNLINQLWPTEGMTTNQKLNAITRLVIILTLLGYLITKTFKILITGVVTLLAIIILRKVALTKEAKINIEKKGLEAFSNPNLYSAAKDSFTEPSLVNPAMNPLPASPPEKHVKPAAPSFNPIVEKNINKEVTKFVVSNTDHPNVDEKLFCDLGDNFQFNQSMRQWHPMPNTQIPNDQDAFAKYCYGDMHSCKDTPAINNFCG